MCSSSVRYSQILDTYTILMPSPYLQVRHSWEMADREKEYSDKVEWTNGLSLNTFLQYFSFNSPKECFRISRLGSGPQQIPPVRSTNSLQKSSHAVSSISPHTSPSPWVHASPDTTPFTSPTSASTGERWQSVSLDYGTGSSSRDQRYLTCTSPYLVLDHWKSA